MLSGSLRDQCFEDVDKCDLGSIIARAVPAGENAFVVGPSTPPHHATLCAGVLPCLTDAAALCRLALCRSKVVI